jgi:hypothetical protein
MATSHPVPVSIQKQDPKGKAFFRLKRQHGICDETELAERVGKLPSSGYLIDGLLQPCSSWSASPASESPRWFTSWRWP